MPPLTSWAASARAKSAPPGGGTLTKWLTSGTAPHAHKPSSRVEDNCAQEKQAETARNVWAGVVYPKLISGPDLISGPERRQRLSLSLKIYRQVLLTLSCSALCSSRPQE